MDAGRCQTCGREFTAGEVAGVGILRARPESRGGPFVEFECPGCRVVQILVPHGQARYAYPGKAPPPPPPEADRRPPWLRGRRRDEPARDDSASAAEQERSLEEPIEVAAAATAPPVPRRVEPARPRTNTDRTKAPEPTPIERACAVLGVGLSADRESIERAYRARALQCHPDKAAHLDEEIRALAERKFKELKAAYDLLLGG